MTRCCWLASRSWQFAETAGASTTRPLFLDVHTCLCTHHLGSRRYTVGLDETVIAVVHADLHLARDGRDGRPIALLFLHYEVYQVAVTRKRSMRH
jgi:hypothetical protein